MSKRKPILLVDMDGVMADYYAQFLLLWRWTYPDRPWLKPEELKHMYFDKDYPEEYKDDIRKIITSKGFFYQMHPIEGAVATLNRILDEGEFDVFLCSTPDTSSVDHGCASEKVRWVEKVLGERWLKKIILTHDKTLVVGDFLIDDKENITGINPNPSWVQVFFTHAYNKDCPGFRLDSWADWDKLKEQLLLQIEFNDHFGK